MKYYSLRNDEVRELPSGERVRHRTWVAGTVEIGPAMGLICSGRDQAYRFTYRQALKLARRFGSLTIVPCGS